MNCLHPITVRNHSKGLLPKETFYHEVPCGHCIACRLNYQRQWTCRLLMELLVPWRGYAGFLTLTYDDEHLPIDQQVHKEDLQKFFKRLRSRLASDAREVRYFACGEYGDTFSRPHYHAIVFGVSQPDTQLLRDCWQLGFIKVGSVEPASIRYVCDYVLKKDSRKLALNKEQEPFVLMSSALGKEFMIQYRDKLKCDGYFSYQGVRYPLPRYFKDRFLSRWEKYKDYVDSLPRRPDFPPDYEKIERYTIQKMNKFKVPSDRIYS